MTLNLKSAIQFSLIGLALYGGLYASAEALVYRTGKNNPLFKTAQLQGPAVDWVILGSSHAMPLSFDGMQQEMEAGTGLRLLNLAALGTGPLYQKFVFEQFLKTHRARGVVYAVDGFAFLSPRWNEDRLADPSLLARTPFSISTLKALAHSVLEDGVAWQALPDFAFGFSKINNRNRFDLDSWDGEQQFDSAMRHSAAADRKRFTYLYPDQAAGGEQLKANIERLQQIVSEARNSGSRIMLLKLPLPAAFKSGLPGEGEFDAALRQLAQAEALPIIDLSDTIPEDEFYFDTDHLNRQGVQRLFLQHLNAMFTQSWDSPPVEHR